MKRRLVVAVFGSSRTSPDSAEWKDAEAAGALLARTGASVLTGGYGGTMTAVSKGATEAGGHSIGVTVPSIFPDRAGANPYVLEEIETASLTDRLGHMFSIADGTIALPGSIGTATELLVAWNINYVMRNSGGRRVPSVAVGQTWRKVGESLIDLVGADAIDIHFEETSGKAVEWTMEQLESL